MTTPPDWYQDPEGAPGDLRYWDGTQWTEHRAPAAAAAAPAPAPAMAADWYQDPEGAPGDLRYWDGTQWTEHRAPAAPAPVAAPPPPAAAPPPPVAAPPPPAAAPPPPAAAPPPPSAEPTPEPVVAAPPPPVEPTPPPAPEPTITPGVAAGMAVGAAAAGSPPPPTAPVSPPSGPPPVAPGGPTPPATPAKRSKAPLFIVLAIVVVLLVVGGVVGVLVLGGGSAKKNPTQWASAFCKNKNITTAAQKVDSAKNALKDEDLDKIAAYLDSLVGFLNVSADTIKSVGTPDITGGKAMIDEVPAAFRDAAAEVKTIADDVRDGSTRSLQRFSASDWDPLEDMSSQARDAWQQVQDQIDVSGDCSAISKALDS